jgi:uncharacterized protein with HEPN domain
MNEITRAYLVEILERTARIQDYTQDGEAAFLADLRTQDAVLRNFEVMGEIVKRLDKSFIELQDLPPLRDALNTILNDSDI